jgi:hypothetical protein
MSENTGPFGTLLVAGQDWDDSGRWPKSTKKLAEDVAPKLAQHLKTLEYKS